MVLFEYDLLTHVLVQGREKTNRVMNKTESLSRSDGVAGVH